MASRAATHLEHATAGGTVLAPPRPRAAVADIPDTPRVTGLTPATASEARTAPYAAGLLVTTALLLGLIPVAARLQRHAVQAHVATGHAAGSNTYLCVELVGWLTVALGYVAFRRHRLGTFDAGAEPLPWLQALVLCPTVALHVYLADRCATLAVDRATQLVAATVIPPAAVWVATLVLRSAEQAWRTLARSASA